MCTVNTYAIVSTQESATLRPFLRKLQLWKALDHSEREAVLALPYKITTVQPGDYIVRQDDRPSHSCLLLSGFACRQKIARDGGRSISAIHMEGDVVDLQNTLLGLADHSVQALTAATVALIPRTSIAELAFGTPTAGMAMWYDTLVDGSIVREWILNIARRDAKARIAHLLCEFGVRLETLGLGDRCSFELPMSQEQIADATGLTSVHVNRSLMALESDGLIARTIRFIAVSNWSNLRASADFDEAYLHLRGRQGLEPNVRFPPRAPHIV